MRRGLEGCRVRLGGWISMILRFEIFRMLLPTRSGIGRRTGIGRRSGGPTLLSPA